MHTRWSYQLVVRLGPQEILPRNTLPSATNDQEKNKRSACKVKPAHTWKSPQFLAIKPNCALVANLFSLGIEWIKPDNFVLALTTLKVLIWVKADFDSFVANWGTTGLSQCFHHFWLENEGRELFGFTFKKNWQFLLVFFYFSLNNEWFLKKNETMPGSSRVKGLRSKYYWFSVSRHIKIKLKKYWIDKVQNLGKEKW